MVSRSMKILAIIPAKLDSKRLSKKNIQCINGLTLIEHSIDYAAKSKYNPDILVSSESEEVEKLVSGKSSFHKRKPELCGDAEVVDVYISIVSELDKAYDLVVCLQPDNPDRDYTFDECVDYMIENNYDDLITINPSWKRSGSVRIFKFDYLKQGAVSKRIGCLRDSATDIHYDADLETVTKKLK